MTVQAKTRTKTLSAAIKELREEDKGKPKGVDKHVTSFKAASASKDGSGTTAGVTEPTSDELAQINEFTRSPKQASDLVVFSTLSCNDLMDRDTEKFDTQTVVDFAKLPQPYSPVGKSYMVGHDYTKLPIGRIFDASTEVIDGATFLKNKVYIPNIESNKGLIENIDFGVNWAVSVGVMLEASECGLTFCDAGMSRWGFCYAGHDKGYNYVKDGEEDSWGYPLPVDSSTKGAELCYGLMKGAKDFYELSQVFLGAQFYASLEKSAGFKGVIKAASAKGVPMLGLSAKEAAELPLPRLDDRAAHALKNFDATWDADGVLKWTDDQRLVWTYDPAETEAIMCLGKDASETGSDDGDEEDADGTAQAEPDADASGEDDPVVDESADAVVNDGEGDDAGDGGDEGTGEGGEGSGSDGGLDDSASDDPATATDDDDNSEEKAVTKAAVLTCLKGIKAPATVLSAVEGAAGDNLDAALSPLVGLIKSQGEQIITLTAKATMGDEYIKSLKTDAIDWFVKANAVGDKGVNTDAFQKMLDQCGDNVELVKGLSDMQKDLAQAKFPASVRRSSFPSDANSASAPGEVPIPDVGDKAAKAVSRLHG
jgi:hypothetical protein